jgi:hypothetical protein
MLNHFEKRRLQAIEQSLETEDPEFAERLKSSSAEQTQDATLTSMSAPLFFGAVFALVTLPASPALAAVILSVPVIITVWVRVLTARIGSATEERPAAGLGDN